MKRILIVNNAKVKCGVHQYGRNFYQAVRDSKKYKFGYIESTCLKDITTALDRGHPSAVIFNYYPITMPWVTSAFTQRLPLPCLGTFHEVTQAEADALDGSLFSIHLCLDPDVKENNPRVKALGRIVPAYENNFPVPEIPTFGAFGFGPRDQGYERVVSKVQEEYDEAVIRIHLPENDVVDPGGRHYANSTAEHCRRLIRKSGIQLEISHEFMSKQGLMDYLAKNTANCFFRDPVPKKGKSSALDFGIAVQRPILLTKCSMYSHVSKVTPSPYIEDRTIKEIVNSGFEPFSQYLKLWSEEQFRKRIEAILHSVV